MPLKNNIWYENFGPNYAKIPVIIALIDPLTSVFVAIDFPPQGNLIQAMSPAVGLDPGNIIYGIELMINPRSMGSNLSKMISRTPTMTSWHEDHWGEELDTLSLQGNTAAFVTPSVNPVTGETLEPYGLTVANRRVSISYRQFKRLIDLIRLNGCYFDNFGRIIYRYYIMLSYGQQAYKGFFESVDVTENAADPFRYQFTITFKSEATLYNYSNSVPAPQPASVVVPTSVPTGINSNTLQTLTPSYGTTIPVYPSPNLTPTPLAATPPPNNGGSNQFPVGWFNNDSQNNQPELPSYIPYPPPPFTSAGASRSF